MTSNRAEMVERVSEVIYDYLDERFPDGAFPGGVQVFADDHLDAEFKHEAGCDELAERILAAIPSAGGVEELERLQSFAVTMLRSLLLGIETNKSVHGWSRESSDVAEKCFVEALTDYRAALRGGQ